MDGKSVNPKEERLKALQEQFPELFAEGKLDIEKLRQSFNDDYVAGDERYRLEWAGKHKVFEEISRRTTTTITADKERSVDFEESQNIFIEGENLEVLRTLQKAYHGKVKMIYIDPPYNTGHDFVYNDDFRDTIEGYNEASGNADGEGILTQAYVMNSKDSGQYHSNWLNMMYPRLYLARNLLRDDGVIFVSIDDNEIHNLRMVMNEIFGEENFIGQLSVQSNPRGSQASRHLASVHEYVLMFAKKEANLAVVGFSKNEATLSEYSEQDEKGFYRLLGLRQRGGAWRREDRPKMHYPIYVNPLDGTVSLIKDAIYAIECLPKRPSGEDGRWTWSREKLQKHPEDLVGRSVTRDGESVFDIYRKDYLLDENGDVVRTKPKTLWLEKALNYQNGRKEIKELFAGKDVFDYPKPSFLIKQCISMLSNEGNDLILDFFSGSGTTAHAVMRQNAEDGGNRKYICVQLPEKTPENSEARKAGYEKISDIAVERIKRASQKIRAEHPEFTGDLGVRVYKQTVSHFPSWRSEAFESDEQLQESMDSLMSKSVTGDGFDRATELLLKLGYAPTTPLKQSNGAWIAGDSEVVLVLEDGAELNAKTLLGYGPHTIIVLESLFESDDAKINFALACKEKNITFQTI